MAAGSPTDAAWLVAAAEPAGVRSGGNDAGPFGNVDRILDPRLRQARPSPIHLSTKGRRLVLHASVILHLFTMRMGT